MLYQVRHQNSTLRRLSLSDFFFNCTITSATTDVPLMIKKLIEIKESWLCGDSVLFLKGGVGCSPVTFRDCEIKDTKFCQKGAIRWIWRKDRWQGVCLWREDKSQQSHILGHSWASQCKDRTIQQGGPGLWNQTYKLLSVRWTIATKQISKTLNLSIIIRHLSRTWKVPTCGWQNWEA